MPLLIKQEAISLYSVKREKLIVKSSASPTILCQNFSPLYIYLSSLNGQVFSFAFPIHILRGGGGSVVGTVLLV